MEESILNSIKKMLGLASEYTTFDTDIVIHINSVFATLYQLGVGPDDGFRITDASTVWNEYLQDSKKFDAVKTYIYLKVRLLFDPPSSSAISATFERMISEYEFRLRVEAEHGGDKTNE